MEGNALGIPVDCRFRRDCHPCHDGPLAPEHFAASPRGHRHSSKLLDSPGWLPQECLEESGAAVLERGQTFSEFLTTRVKSESPRTEVQRLAFRPHLAVAQATAQTQVKKPLCGGNRSQLSCGLWMVRCAHRPETGSPQLTWLARRQRFSEFLYCPPITPEAAGSSPVVPASHSQRS